MRLLLDTHALLWWWGNDPKLPPRLRSLIGDRRNEVNVSAVSGWEIANKVRSGKMPEMNDYIGTYDTLVVDDGFKHLAISHDHAVTAGLLEGTHRDPFDRMLAAQALTGQLTVVTRDRQIAAFGCATLW